MQRVDGTIIEDMFRIIPGAAGAATVTGLGAYASFGIDTIANSEALHFTVNPFDAGRFVEFRLTPSVQPPAGGNPGFVNGTVGADTLDIAVLLPAVTAADAVNANGNAGNDVISGHAGINSLTGGTGDDSLDGRGGNDRLEGKEGNDRIEGGEGSDFALFIVPDSVAGPYRVIDGASAGTFIVERSTSGTFATTEALFNVTVVGISAADAITTVTGVGLAAHLGTDTLTGVERLNSFPTAARSSPRSTWPSPALRLPTATRHSFREASLPMPLRSPMSPWPQSTSTPIAATTMWLAPMVPIGSTAAPATTRCPALAATTRLPAALVPTC